MAEERGSTNKQDNESTIKYAKTKQDDHSCVYQFTIEDKDVIFWHKSKVEKVKTSCNNYLTIIKKSQDVR